MKLTLDVKIPLEIQEGGKLKEKLEVFYRDFTKKEKKELETLVEKFKNLFKRANKLSKKEVILNKKIDLCEKSDKFEKAFKFIEEKETLLADIEKLEDELESLGGDDFEEEMAKKRFDLLVSGNDKEKLREYAVIKGYSTILKILDTQKADIEKKQLGE